MSVYDLTGRKALVTGGARGLGEGMAQALARAGAAVVIGDIREDLGKTCADSLRAAGGTAEFVQLDVTSDESWERAIPEVISCLGPAGQGGAIVNVASVAATIAFPGIAIYSATKSAVDRLTRVAAMEAGKLGYGVRVNSVYPGLVPTEMGAQLANDVASIGLFESTEAAVGAVVELTPLGRLGEVADMADAVVFLASDGARFITGAGLPVDGGMGM
jgi:3alpha(or 20beta)-hydroxysteroid dehydrogenase